MHLTTRFEDIADPAALELRWRALEGKVLERRSRTPSFFLRWTWMGSWLGALADAGIALPQLMMISEDGKDIALALVGQGRARRKLGGVPALWLNEAGHKDGDRPFIEYNGLLCRPEHQLAAAHAFCEAMAARHDWKLLMVSGTAFASPLHEVADVRRTVLRDASPAYFVDLDAVRDVGGDYLSLLSANTRNQIRRSLKEELSEPVPELATDAATLETWLADMQRLNAGRHADNAWDSAFFRNFVRRLALAGLEDGSVELLRVMAGGEPLGYLLNFRWAGRAMNYQSAFAEPRTGKSKPGLMCHAIAVERYAQAGLDRYSLLAGKDRYKQSLSTGAEELHWWTLERFDWRLEAEALLRKLLGR
tara:strand:+ start:47115 stop:48203 length:1089 start_codon:yes stop_codon:yes gene_type:complete